MRVFLGTNSSGSKKRNRMVKIHLYILLCADNSYYTGTSKNLEGRIIEHNNGLGGSYTRQRMPVKLVYSEGFENYYDAFCAERRIKKWSRKKKEALINRDFEELVRLSNHNKFSKQDESAMSILTDR